jgi:phosphatidylinositol kinase/protein kinase (PI-3  family)
MQLITLINQILRRKSKIKCKLFPYEILAAGTDCGLIQFVEDALSIDYIRKTMSQQFSRKCDLLDYFVKNFGDPKSEAFKKA